jgi:hypothetical protein
MKQAVIAPSMLALLYPLDQELPDYSRQQFEDDLASECEKDIRQAFAAGAARVSIDFTEGRPSTRNDARNPWTGRNMLPHFIELNNQVLNRFTADERSRIGVHTCPGGDRDSVHSADVDYNDLLPSMFQINAGYFLIQLASERDRDRVYGIIGKNLREDANGVLRVLPVQHRREAEPWFFRLCPRRSVPEDHEQGAGDQVRRREARPRLTRISPTARPAGPCRPRRSLCRSPRSSR